MITGASSLWVLMVLFVIVREFVKTEFPLHRVYFNLGTYVEKYGLEDSYCGLNFEAFLFLRLSLYVFYCYLFNVLQVSIEKRPSQKEEISFDITTEESVPQPGRFYCPEKKCYWTRVI